MYVSDFLLGEFSGSIGGFYTDFSDNDKYNRVISNPEHYKLMGIDLSIEYMAPSEYIRRAAKGFNVSIESCISVCNKDSIEKYKNLLLSGHIFPIPILVYNKIRGTFLQEGRHRSIAAHRAGIKEIPVAVITVNSDALDLDIFGLEDSLYGRSKVYDITDT